MEQVEVAETPPKPKKPKMVNVYNAHKFKSLHIARGKIGPGCSGKIPLSLWESVKDANPWLKRAERGDVIK